MKNIIFACKRAPFEGVRHAGGVNAYFAYRSLEKRFPDANISLFAFGRKGEEEAVRKEGYKNATIPFEGKRIFFKILRKLGWFSKHYAYLRIDERITFRRFLKSKRGEKIDLIWLYWTEMTDFLPLIRKWFPEAKTLLFESDVRFLGFQRRYENCSRFPLRQMRKHEFKIAKQREIEAANNMDYVVVHNAKDRNLLVENGVNGDHIYTVYPLIEIPDVNLGDFTDPTRNGILFYGAMNRPENIDAVMWFIKNVMPMLNESIRLYVVGNCPPEKLISMASDRIVITGFVDDPAPYYAGSFAMIVPLRLGAGIKIKTMQGLAAGLPVVASDVGTEGIPCVPEEHYLRANEASEYVEAIERLFKDRALCSRIAQNGRLLIAETINPRKDMQELVSKLG